MLQIWLLKVTPFMMQRPADRRRLPRFECLDNFQAFLDVRGMVVVAEGEREARATAHVNDERNAWWLDPALTTCELVEMDTEYVVLKNEPTG